MPIRYQISIPSPATHRVQVRASFPGGPTTLVFPSWAPGSYLMREFGRMARDFAAWTEDGRAVPIVQQSRNEWRVTHPGPFTVGWEVYCHEKSVRTPYVDASLVFFLPSNVLLYDAATRLGTFVVEVEVPAGHVGVCPLGPEVSGPALAVWTAPDLDTLMDSPIAIGPFEHTSFAVDGVPHHHWIEPGHNGDLARMNRDLEHIVTTARDTVAPGSTGFPYPRYDFVTLHMTKGHGGLEHKACSVLIRPRNSFADAEGYEEFLTLAAHEHFHAWNVKRIHPDTLGPTFDYGREHHTRDLWWLEGGTVYYEERIAYRAGLVSPERHLARLADLAQKLQNTPGRRHLSLEDASFGAWVKLYRPSEDSGNSTVSYYLKGAVVIWILDLELLHRTEGRLGVDDLLRALWEGWGRHGRGYPERTTLRTIATELAGGGGDWERWWAGHVLGTDDVALREALDHAGYDLAWGARPAGGWLGLGTRGGERILVDTVREDGPCNGVLSPGDEVLALGGDRVLASDLADRLKRTPPGTTLPVLFARDGRVASAEVLVGTPLPPDLKITERPAIDDARRRVRAAWLSRPRAG
jgi:predicted metalloprotease with PDZ domain